MSKIQQLIDELRSRASQGDFEAVSFMGMLDSRSGHLDFPQVTPINETEFGFSLSPADQLKVSEFNRRFGEKTQENFNRNEAMNRRLIETAMRSGFI